MAKKDTWFMDNHEQMIEQRVLVLDSKNGNWRGIVTSVVDEEYFLVSDGEGSKKVSMFHLRIE